MSDLNFPPHKCGLYLTHNEHRDTYENLAEWLENHPAREGLFFSQEAKERAIKTDECWVIQWYPDTPVGFLIAAAPTLGELLEAVNTK